MKKLHLTIAAVLAFSSCISFPRWGIVDESGNLIRACEFEKAYPFSEGFAAVYADGGWGLLSENGDLVVSNADGVGNFSEGFAPVLSGGGIFYIDVSGETVIEGPFQSAWAFSSGLARVKTDEGVGVINTGGAFVISPKYLKMQDHSEGIFIATLWDEKSETKRKVALSTNGIELFSLPPDAESIADLIYPLHSFAESYFPDEGFDERYLKSLTNNLFGDDDELMLAAAIGLSEVDSSVSISALESFLKTSASLKSKRAALWSLGKLGSAESVSVFFDYIDSGDEDLAMIALWSLGKLYEFKIGSFLEGLAVIQIGEKYGYIDTEGKIAIAPDYEDAGIFSGGFACVKDGLSWHYIDENGEDAFDGQSFTAAFTFTNGIALVQQSLYSYALLSTNGDLLLSGLVSSDFYPSEGIAVCELSGVYYFVTTDGSEVARDLEDALPFSGGLAAAKKGGLWGYLNTDGDFAIEPQFNDALSFSGGLAAVKSGHLWGFIDENGDFVIEPSFKDVMSFDNGTALVKG